MTHEQDSDAGRTFAFIAFPASFLLTLASLLLDNVTFATNDYMAIVLGASGCALAAIVLVWLAWKRMPAVGRLLSAFMVLANLWTLFDTLGRRLPALLDT